MVDRSKNLEWFLEHRHAEMPLWMVLLEPTDSCPAPHSDEFRAALRDHFVYWWELEEAGVLLGAGPLDFDRGTGVGMAILRAPSRGDAERYASAEPMARLGYRRNAVQEWQLNEGAFVELLGST